MSGCAARDAAKGESLSARDQVALQRAALLTLFVQREHVQQMVFWSDTASDSPTLQLLRTSGLALVAVRPDTAALALPMPVHLETLATLEGHFRAYADGWEAWFRLFPASSGVVVLTRPVRLPPGPDDADRAALVIGRTCGEHCHSAWRITLARAVGTAWRTVSVVPLPLPRD